MQKHLFFVLFVFLLTNISTPAQLDRPIGVNLSGIHDYSPQWMFVDAMKQCRPWIVQPNAGSPWSVDTVAIPSRPDGYPLEVPFVQGTDSFIVHTLLLRELEHLYPAGDYTLIFEGTGEIQLNFDAGNQTFTSPGPHTFAVVPSGGGIHLTIHRSDVNDPIRNIRVIMPGFAGTYESEPFHPQFLDYLRPFGVYRYMDPLLTNGGEIEAPADRATPDFYCQNSGDNGGLAFEYIAALSNETETDPWINIPHRATDDYVEEVASVLRDSLDPNRMVYIEYGNEHWNTAWPYNIAHGYCRDSGLALGMSTNDYQAALRYSAYRSLQIFEIFEDVFGDDNRLVKVMASQAANDWTGLQMLEVAEDSTWNPEGIEVDAIAIAPYFGGNIGDDIGNAGMISTITVAEILDSVEAQMPISTQEWVMDYAALSDSFEVDLFAYEGGQHLVGVQYINDTTLTRKLIEANRHPRMRSIYCDYYDVWYNNGGDLFCAFSFMSGPSKYGSWGLLEHMEQDTADAPKWMAHWDCVFEQDQPTALDPSEVLSRITVYPNPNQGAFTVDWPFESAGEARLVDLLGKEVGRYPLSPGANPFRVRGYQPGLYLLELRTRDGQNQTTRKIILQ